MVAIVGGGISGLAAAFELQRRGVPFVLYERSPVLGGLIRTERVDGYTIDAGPDALLIHRPAALELCRALRIDDRLQPQRARATFVVRRERLRELPAASVMGLPTQWMPFWRSGAFSMAAKLRMAADLWLPSSKTVGDESIASFVRRRFGDGAVDYLAEPLLAGIHGGDAEQLSMRSAFPHLVELESRDRSVILGLKREVMSRRRSGAATAAPFVTLAGGMTELPRALAAFLPRSALRRGIGVAGIVRVGPRFRLDLTDGSNADASAVLLATPPPVTAQLTRSIDPDLAACCAEIRMASIVTVALGYQRTAVAHPLNGAGFVVPRCEGLTVRAVSWVSSKWSGRAPLGAVLLRAFLGGILQPDVIDLDDATLIDRVRRDCRTLLGIQAEPQPVRLYRWPNATPQLEVGHLDRMQRIDARLAAHRGLFVSASGFRGTGIADAVADARRQAARAAAWAACQDERLPQPIAV